MIALIPARLGSVRSPGKNTRLLGGKPLLQWSIEAAQASGLFCSILVSTDDPVAKRIAWLAGVGVHDRKPLHATSEAVDYLWVADVMRGRQEEIYAILRPTSPFRDASTIRRGYAELIASHAHAVRAITPTTPVEKCWQFQGRLIVPVRPGVHDEGTPWHSSPTQSLPVTYRQTAALELCWTWALWATGSICGFHVAGLVTDARESLDINTDADFLEAERLV